MEVISFFVKNSYAPRAVPAYSVPIPFSFQRMRRLAAASAGARGRDRDRQRSERRVLNVRKVLKVLPFALLCAAVPFLVLKAINYSESFARPVIFANSGAVENDYLDKAMFDFALAQDTYFDLDGNLVSADGTALASLSEAAYKEPVTYQQYVVRSGDTIGSISQKFGLSNISTLIAMNDIANVRYLYSGKKLTVPSMDGMKHVVAAGETLEGLSAKYAVAYEDLLDVNDLDSSVLTVGQVLFIPGAKMDKQSLQKAMGERFTYPITAKWRLSSGFGARKDPITGVNSSHTGIDMACPTGTRINAALSGTVAFVGWSNVFGNYVIIKHIDGYQTLYGHMSKISTKKGAFVNQGEKIGEVGSTGYSTGPHLHFTVYKNGKLVNPMTVLK
ncbi:MAG: M23 family metallopeptidase [Treponema sp.]|nr:M23 family metallopeptidase [Treponema sp.]